MYVVYMSFQNTITYLTIGKEIGGKVGFGLVVTVFFCDFAQILTQLGNKSHSLKKNKISKNIF